MEMNIEYLPETHTYLVNGVITPSTTQIIHKLKPDKYKGIPASVLKTAAQYGDIVHEAIEEIGQGRDILFREKSYEGIAIRRFRELKVYHELDIISVEQPVAYMDKDEPLFAGRYDMVGTVRGEWSVIDIKTTSKYDREYLELQLSMYVMALQQKGLQVDKAYCLWLPKKALGTLLEVDVRRPEELLPEIRKAKEAILTEWQIN